MGLGGGTIAAALTVVRISQHLAVTRYGALGDHSVDLAVGLGAGIALAAGFGWRRSKPLDNEVQRVIIGLLSIVGALLMAFIAVPFWHFFHFAGLVFWTLANLALGVAGSVWAVRGAGKREA